MAEPLRVHYGYTLDETGLAILHDKLDPAVQVTTGPELPQPATYHILVAGRPERAHLQASPDLHTVIIPWAGLGVTTRDLLLEFPHLAVHNLHHNAVPTAELALALLLAATKFIVPFDQSLRRHDWSPRSQPSPAGVLDGRTALILGYGAIGRRVARACRALGMTVLATRRSPEQDSDETANEIHPPQALTDLLPRADAVIICLPLTPETEGLLGPYELALLPPGAVMVNIGRGAIIDESALYEALRDKRLRAAGLDVWYTYPAGEETRTNTPPSAFPFHELDNVVMSPHRGGGSDETDSLRMTHLARLLNAAARGEPLPNAVNLQAGY